MRKLDLDKTKKNIEDKASTCILYGNYGLTENNLLSDKPYAVRHIRFSCAGNGVSARSRMEQLFQIFHILQMEYLCEFNIATPIFYIRDYDFKTMPYDTIVLDFNIEELTGAFHSVVGCVGQDLHQFHASDIWVRANEKAGVWKSLYDETSCDLYDDTSGFTYEEKWFNAENAEKWLQKVRDARLIAKDCIKRKGEITNYQKYQLVDIKYR